jgi:hypothetical protein
LALSFERGDLVRDIDLDLLKASTGPQAGARRPRPRMLRLGGRELQGPIERVLSAPGFIDRGEAEHLDAQRPLAFSEVFEAVASLLVGVNGLCRAFPARRNFRARDGLAARSYRARRTRCIQSSRKAADEDREEPESHGFKGAAGEGGVSDRL